MMWRSLRRRISRWWYLLPARWKAAIRTAGQTIGAGLGLFVLALLGEAIEAVSGDGASWGDVLTAAQALGLVVLGALSGLVSFAMNGSSGIAYAKWPPPVPREE